MIRLFGLQALRLYLPLLCLALLVCAAGPALAEKRVALVIGNNSYAHATVLANAVNDATDVSSALRGVGFEVVTATDTDLGEMRGAIRKFAAAARDADVALFYYSGHGMQWEGENVLVPIDATFEQAEIVPLEVVPMDEVVGILGLASKARIIILDACRDNDLERTLKIRAAEKQGKRSTSISRGLAKMSAARGQVIVYATQPDQTADDAFSGGSRNSPFTHAFIDSLKQPGVEVGRLFRRVAANVDEITGGKQLPEISISLLGDFYFREGEGGEETQSGNVTGAAIPKNFAQMEIDFRRAQATATRSAWDEFLGIHGRERSNILVELAREARDRLEVASLAPNPSPKQEQVRTRSLPRAVKSCFAYVGPVAEVGWTFQHDQGRQQLEKLFGEQAQTAYLENVPEGSDAERQLERFARDGCEIIFATSFGYMDAVQSLARKYPDTKFEHATGYKRQGRNVSTYNSRTYEGRYIQGQIAARMSRTGVAGYIASFSIPEVVMGINAFTLGARSVDPDFVVKIHWAHTWYDPQKEMDAARDLIARGADILTQQTDSVGPLQVAAEMGIKAFGQSTDMIRFAPETQLTAIIDNWGAYYARRVEDIANGRWKSADVWAGIGEGVVEMAPYMNMPDDVKAMAEETEAGIRSASLHPFTGPVRRQDGSLWLKPGEVAQDSTLLGMNFYVEGVDDKPLE